MNKYFGIVILTPDEPILYSERNKKRKVYLKAFGYRILEVK